LAGWSIRAHDEFIYTGRMKKSLYWRILRAFPESLYCRASVWKLRSCG